jgi:hypothetical protein
MGLFKSVKDLAGVTRQAKALQNQQQEAAGYKPGMGGALSQMGDMLGQMNEQLADLTGQAADEPRLLAEGVPGEAVIVAMGTPERGAQRFNLDLDLEVHVGGQAPYRVANQYIVPASAPLGPGVRLPVRVDASDPSRLAIDWANVAAGPARGEVRPAAGAARARDPLAELEKLGKLRDSGVLTDAEFAEQKARILRG